jgi:hypothetical protein
MDMTRFETLAAAYGGDLRRWPVEARAAAEALLESQPQAARAVLAEADALDALLHQSPTPAVSHTLREAILAAAPKPRRQGVGFGFWLSGAGLAAATVSGVIIGASMLSALTADVRIDAVLAEALYDDALEELPLSVSSATKGARA